MKARRNGATRLYLLVSLIGITSAISGTWAADRLVRLQFRPPVRKGVAALPSIADPADDAERRINAAVRQLDVRVRKESATCKDPGGSPGWTRTVEVPMVGPGFISYVIRDDAFCGGAHPASGTMAIVYDLRTGRPVDWTSLLPATLTGKVALKAGIDGTKVVTLSSKRLYELYVAAYHLADASAQDQTDCKQAVQNIGSDEQPRMMAWVSSKPAGLAVQYDLSNVVQNCAVPVVISPTILKTEGATAVLLEAIDAAKKK